MPHEPALAASGDRMSERSRHRVSEGQDARSERPATGHGQPRPPECLQIRWRPYHSRLRERVQPDHERLVAERTIVGGRVLDAVSL
jgi:hypothetical protein